MQSVEQQMAQLQDELNQERHLRQQTETALQKSLLLNVQLQKELRDPLFRKADGLNLNADVLNTDSDPARPLDFYDRQAIVTALQISEQRYSTLIQAVPVGIFRTDPEGHCLYVNDRWCEMTGLTLVEAHQDGWASVLHPDDHDRIFTEWYDCAQQNLPFQSEYRFQKRNGQIIWVMGQAVAERGLEGQLLGYIGSITDITAAKETEAVRAQAEAELKQSEHKFRAVFDNMFQFIGLLTPDGLLLEGNQTAFNAVSVDRADVIGKPFWETPWWTHNPQLQEKLRQSIDRAANGELVKFEAEHLLADGSTVFVDFSLKPVFDDQGKVILLIPEGRDVTDLKQTELQWQEREEFLRSIYNGVEQAVFVVDVTDRGEFCYVGFNPVSERNANVSNQQIQGKTPEEAFGKELGTAMSQNYARCIEAGTSIQYEEQLVFKAHTISTLTTLSPLRNEAGQIYRIVGTATDISDRKQIEEALRESQQRLQALMDNSTAIIYMKDIEGRYLLINHSYETIFNLDRNRIVGKTDHDIFPQEIADAFQANDREVIAAGVAIETEEVAPREDGLHTYLSIKFPLFDSNGHLYAVCGMSTDISDRKQKEELLRNISLGVSTKSDKALFQDLAEYLTKTLDVDYAIIGELIQPDCQRVRTIAVYGDGQRLENFEYALANTPCEQVLTHHTICSYPNQIQQQFPLDRLLQEMQAESFMGIPLLDSTDRVLGLITILSHQPWQEPQLMTEILNIFAARAAAELERQQAELELQRQKQDLARSNADLQQFAYVASHDLQEPLRMVTSYLELLERRYKGHLDSKADQFIDFAVDGAARMQILINDLLSYSRLGTREPTVEAVNCTQVLQDALTNLQVTIDQNKAIITHDILPEVKGDRTQLIQLFQNLISNGLKFRREETPRIHVGVQFISGQWLFSICDNGIGIEPEYTDRIFVIFQRLHSRSEYPGTGIGLALCKKIVERQGGKLWVESQLGQGSTFYFTLPNSDTTRQS